MKAIDVHVHPGTKEAPLAHHIIASANFDEIRDPSRDQTATRKALAELKILRQRYPDSPYGRQADNRIRIAEATGGRAFFPFQIRDVSDAFMSIQDELRSQYAMAYKPADFAADGRYRTIEILAQEKSLKVRTRKGYYAPKQ